jgi:hypothetical protein
VALLETDVVQAVPLEQHLTGRDVDLLHDPVEDHAVGRTAHRRQVARDLVVGDDQGGAARGEAELVGVRGQPVAGPHRGDDLVAAVDDVVDPLPVAGPLVALSLPPGQDRLAPVALHPEVGHPWFRA